MKQFKIERPLDDIRQYLQEKIDNLTKPKGSLGLLEDIAMQTGWIQQTLNPKLKNPCHIVFAGDHGIAAEGVSPSPQEVTYQMIANFWDGGAGINFLARQHGFNLKIVDAGVNFDFKPEDPIIDKKIRKSTRNYLHEAAMTREEMDLAIERGAECAQSCFDEGCNIIGFGEMGITNTSSSSLWMACLTGIPLEKCIGAGCDHTGSIINHKYNVLKTAIENYKGDGSILDIMRYFGGYEMVMAVGAMLKAAELKMIVLVDGFIMTNCILLASKLNKEVLNYAIFGHQGDEAGHKLLLEYLGAKPILHLGLRLGEGTGALCAYPIIESALHMINEMNSFKQIQVTKYF
ncbi:nicotinate-nucleotide--dimethylbenzimidazole phosphoribosyltransferase [Dysgonomonas hofstadii]|uniref:Nicotinate-nucleotide--dimethylbenzimidazole phosphoribosyltransferase n=1 Tax=Dysgonomonas hofstadii TaxID=637886 RepID=A0A840CJR6_9BACT|nr:nicotinate-nucleotide--dimethylbenzimidazole phosphoribosyltransferase [Dysgonomonas hofstadii]MBB4034919.1 nicotinate-nucleotide--dimethylbenzimidazole phosphoribosyltransferase [Dysgonomonas hofstadii]